MSYEDGLAAINLEMPARVPRTEHSVSSHWDLIKVVTGIEVTSLSTENVQYEAKRGFRMAWNFDFYWRCGVERDQLDKMRTRMGTGEYESGGVDKDTTVYCPFENVELALNFQPQEVYGNRDRSRIVSMINEIYSGLKSDFAWEVPTAGSGITLISGLMEVFGWDMFLMAMGTDPQRFGQVANRYAAWYQQFFDALAETDVEVVMVHDDITWTSGAFAKPAWYREFVFPNYKKYFAPIKEAGKKIAYTSDGNFTEFIDDIVETGVDGFVLEPVTDMKYIAKKYGKTHFFIGNADTNALLGGNRDQIRAEVERCMDIGKKCPGFFMAVGNHLPSNTPIESAIYYNEVYQELSRR